ncbi:MAG: hypothetical protein LBT56_04575 [Prevotellaceae bacterium]|nr:hypothetical protein [Prevotellaceae bacterium]
MPKKSKTYERNLITKPQQRNLQYEILQTIEQYQDDNRYNRSWLIGFSGGKDSTVLLTLDFERRSL